MKSIFHLTLLASVGFYFVSCSSSRPIVDDNVYLLKTAALPIGENLLDETSYSTFKYREEQNNPTSGYYDPTAEANPRREPNFLFGRPMFFYGLYGMSGNNFLGYNTYMHFGPGSYYNPFFSPYGYYNPNSFYGGFGGYGGYYSNYNGFGGGYYGSQIQTTTNPGTSLGHYVSGPRSTNSGYYSGVSRGGTQQLKNASTVAGNIHSNPSTTNQYLGSKNAQVNRTSNKPVDLQQNSGKSVTYSRNSGNSGSRTVQQRGNIDINNNSTSRPTTVVRESGTVRSTSPRSSGGSVSAPSHSTPSNSSPSRSSSPSTGGGRRN